MKSYNSNSISDNLEIVYELDFIRNIKQAHIYDKNKMIIGNLEL